MTKRAFVLTGVFWPLSQKSAVTGLIIAGALWLGGAVAPATVGAIDFTSTLSAVRAQDLNGMVSGPLLASPTLPAVAAITNNGILLPGGFGFDAAVAASASGDLGAAAAVDCFACPESLLGGQGVVSNAQLFDNIRATGSFRSGDSIHVTITEVLTSLTGVTPGGHETGVLDTSIGRDASEHRSLFPDVIFSTLFGQVHLATDSVSPLIAQETFSVPAESSGGTSFQLFAQLTAAAFASGNGSAFVNALSTGRIFIDAPPGITLTAASGHDYSTPGGLPSPVPEPATLLLLGSGLVALTGIAALRNRRRG